MRSSRRGFLKLVTSSGIALSLAPIGAAAEPVAFEARETLPGHGGGPAIAGRGRVDGFAKVTGAKLYASDFRAVDMPGWPAETAHALLVRAPDASHVCMGLDLTRLPSAPAVVVTAVDLEDSGIRVPEFYAGDLFCPVGTTPLYLGQPVALLLFEDFTDFDRARLVLRDGSGVTFGARTGPVERPNYAAFRFTRVAGATPSAPDVYSPAREGWVSPGKSSGGRPIWEPLPAPDGRPYVAAATHGEEIRAELDRAGPGVLVLDRPFETQSIDPMFLEPESGLAWFEPEARRLEIVIGVQSPYEAATALDVLLGEAVAPLRPEEIALRFAYVGGGFGGRDHTPFPLYVALAALFLPGRPVRLAHDRFQQFQGGVKRHAFRMRTRIGVDRASGRITAFAADHELDGGGLANYSASVAVVGATGAIGIYDIPKVDVTTVAAHSRGVTAGSMRGYGTLQTMTALEVLIDEAAAAVSLDPIEFRRRNALATGGRTMTGNTYNVSIRAPEVLDKLEAHEIWRRRDALRVTGAEATHVIGTGVACVTKDYGTGADCCLGSVEIDREGRLIVRGDAVEMGNGIGTALANRVAYHLGSVAEAVSVARIDTFGPLGLVTSGDPYAMDQATQDAAAKDPRWVPAISSATSASIGAHVGTHAAAEAARVLFRFGLWPAALELWSIPPDDVRAALFEDARWLDGQLTFAGMPALSLRDIAAQAHESGHVTGAMAHGFSRWAWAAARFRVGDAAWTADIDALALRRGAGPFAALDREAVFIPPTDYNRIGTAYTSMCGTLVRVEIERATGALRIAKAYSVLECGQALVPEVVLGQSQGGFAMGVGYALIETLPPFEDGPGNGQWNLGQYLVARGSDLPLRDLEIEVLAPVSPDEPPKGMAEVVMIPVVPALLNAIHDATGHRFQSLPVTAAMLREILA
jgi:CO/xanthine dehydrogenase Mo-binding subunit